MGDEKGEAACAISVSGMDVVGTFAGGEDVLATATGACAEAISTRANRVGSVVGGEDTMSAEFEQIVAVADWLVSSDCLLVAMGDDGVGAIERQPERAARLQTPPLRASDLALSFRLSVAVPSSVAVSDSEETSRAADVRWTAGVRTPPVKLQLIMLRGPSS
mmetsp:Transcript_26784/g.81038  ORF Transcript_26784/g.81038 Transcript_26784/m.81038 type:complete len:162 (+) Transcript_26784:911-1396(+)